MQTPRVTARDDGRRRAAAAALLAVMTLLSLFLWIGVPVMWMRIASLFTPDSQAFYLLLLVVVPLTMIGVGWVLSRVNGIYVRVSGEEQPREHTSWLQSQAADRRSRQPRRAIDVIMAFSVALALIAFTVWFFLIAGSPLPPAS
jgi:divalent metal cation (Fe/Co/Zn/Cd) transporter